MNKGVRNLLAGGLVFLFSGLVLADQPPVPHPQPFLRVLFFRPVIAQVGSLGELCAEIVHYRPETSVPVTVTSDPGTAQARPYPISVFGNQGVFCALIATATGRVQVSFSQGAFQQSPIDVSLSVR
jgi:hypothetical protein